ncbi:hypothetical protein [Nostoc sp.]|uniref:hypothetical protein n=1 Tax=Nostoc sp. TaxID=1180 RepID=UPI002FF5D172
MVEMLRGHLCADYPTKVSDAIWRSLWRKKRQNLADSEADREQGRFNFFRNNFWIKRRLQRRLPNHSTSDKKIFVKWNVIYLSKSCYPENGWAVFGNGSDRLQELVATL